MLQTIRAIFSWAITLYICKVFLVSLPYKFTQHPDTQHIFGKIGDWMADVFSPGLGQAFKDFGAYAVGGFELLTSLVLLAPIALWLAAKLRGHLDANTRSRRPQLHKIGGLMAAAVMCGAVFFHLFTPLGIEVLHQGESDGGSLFRAARRIVGFGLVLFVLNFNWRRR